jgi:rubredoxin
MALHNRTATGSRLNTFDKNICPQCSAWLLAPDWSEHFSERCVRHAWSCDACGHAFETAVFFPALQQAAA